MKCPIKKLESDCIQDECPFYRENGSRCGYAATYFAVEVIAECVEDDALLQMLADCRMSQHVAAEVRK